MGMEMTTTLTAYLSIPSGMKDEKVEVFTDKYGNKTNHRYDPETGQPNTVNIVNKRRKVHPTGYPDGKEEKQYFDDHGLNWYFFRDYEGLGGKEYQILIPDVRVANFDEYCDTPDFSLKGINPEKEIEEFKTKHRKYIEFYEKKYGEVNVDFGLVTYWS